MKKKARNSLIALLFGALVLAGVGQALGEQKSIKPKEKDKDAVSCVATAKGPLTPGGRSAESEKPAVQSPAVRCNGQGGAGRPGLRGQRLHQRRV